MFRRFRRLIDKLRGRKKEVDKHLAFSEALGLLENLDLSVEIDLSYIRGLTEVEFYSENSQNVLEFLRWRFGGNPEKCLTRYQVFTERHEREYTIKLEDVSQEVNITYSTQIS